MTYAATVLLSALSCVQALPASTASNANWLTTRWDVIIVGAGPAGIIVADRMSEAGLKTLLLEQGGPSYYITGGRERPDWLSGTDLSRVDVPGLYNSIYTNPGQNLLCNSSTLNAYGGCTIGGCTAINAGLFFQPPSSDFNKYFPQQWKFSDMSNAIAKLRVKQPFTQDPSANGLYYVQSGYNAAMKWLVDGAGYDAVTFNDVPNDKTKVFGRPEYMYENGQRSGPVKTYLQTSLARPNFHFEHSVQVKRVVRKGKQATGVVAIVQGAQKTINLSKTGRVVLSGGALFSPQLLILSGIGATTDLKAASNAGLLKLPQSSWIQNQAVGAGLFDNPNTFIELSGPTIQSYVSSYNNPKPADSTLYLSKRSGPYAFASQTSAFWTYVNGVGVQGTINSAGFGSFTSQNTITLNVYGTSGLGSTGRVALNSQTGAPGPAQGFFYQSGTADADAIATFIHDIFQALPGSGLTPLNIKQSATQQEIKSYITSDTPYTGGSVNHWSSSCRLGTCLDVNATVKGTNNIYVVDGSMVPPLTTNPSMGIMIAAERAAELILAQNS